MNFGRVFICVVTALVLSIPAVYAEDDEQIEKRSVSASVVSTLGEGVGIRAKKVPGEFTIPEGCIARNFKMKFHDPKSKVKLDKLTGSSIYSVTEGRYMSEAANRPDFELPPGKYKFVVGGGPGAYGTLSFEVGAGEVTCKGVDHELPDQFEVSTEDMYYAGEDGTHTDIERINEGAPLTLSYKNGQFSGEHKATLWETPYPKTKYRKLWTTTIDASLTRGVLSGTYVEHYSLADFSDPTYAEGFTNYKRTISGTLSGTVDASGRLPVTISNWTVKLSSREYGGAGGQGRVPKIINIKGWKEAPVTHPRNYTIEFELQLPVKK